MSDDDWASVPPLDSYADDADRYFSPAPPPKDGEEMPPERICAALPLNDYGNGQRFKIHFGNDALFVGRVGWHVWDEKRWLKDDEISKGISPQIRARAQKMGELIEAEIPHLEPSPKDKELLAEERRLRDRRSELEATPEAERGADHSDTVGTISARLKSIETLLKSHKSLIGRRLTHAKNAGNSGPLSNMINEASVMISRQLPEMDASPLDVNTMSGILRFTVEDDQLAGSFLQPGEPVPKIGVARLIPHDRSELLTKMVPVAYDPVATCPGFDAFLRRIMPEERMRKFLQRWFGYSMTALTSEQALCFFYGMGANGKSVLVDLMARILGDYAATAKIESLTGSNRRGGGDATPDLVPLIGARMVRASEPDKGVQWQEGLIKEFTGGEPILVRALHSDFVEVEPKFKLTISGNHKPDIRGTDDGIWRRLKIVPFEQQIPKHERDPHLTAKLMKEAPGILNWLRDGLVDYLSGGLQEPEEVLLATSSLREESDPYGMFLDDACVVSGDSGDSLPTRELVQAFHFWLADRGEGTFKDRTVALALKDRSRRWQSPKTGQMFTERKSNGTMRYDGIRFTDIFGRLWDQAPKDSTGRALGGRRAEGDA